MTDAPRNPEAGGEPVEIVAPSAVKVGERVRVTRQALYGAGVLRPTAPADLAAVGLPESGDVPALVVLANEHPHLTPPALEVRDRGGQAALVLTWIEPDPMQELPEVAEVTYGWRVDGKRPRWLVLRKAVDAAGMTAELAPEHGAAAPATATSIRAAEGPGVSIDPAYLLRGTDGFFAQYGQPRPAGLGDGLALAAVRPTASGRKATAMEALPLSSGGARLRLTVPLDAGLPVWGPRAGDEVAVFSLPLPQGAHEWLLELQ